MFRVSGSISFTSNDNWCVYSLWKFSDSQLKIGLAVPSSASIREGSSCSRWKQILRPTARHYTESETLEYPALNGMSPSNLSPESRGPHRRGDRKSVRSKGKEDTRRTWFPKSTEKGPCEFIESEAIGTGLTWVCSRSSVFIFQRSWDSWLCDHVGLWCLCFLLRPVLLLLGCLVQPPRDSEVFSYSIFLCHIWLLSLRSLLFSTEREKGVDPEGGHGQELARGNCN